MDAPWVRTPPSSTTEFIGADYSTVISDLVWTLDDQGMYLAPGVMRFKKGWTMFKEILERFFFVGVYDSSCFNCVGPKAITTYVKSHRRELELGGFTILPSRVFYPKNWVSSHELVKALPGGPTAAREALREMIEKSWSIHLFGKMTNHIKIEQDSIVGEAFSYFSLKIPRRFGLLSTSSKEIGFLEDLGKGLELMLPVEYRYQDRGEMVLLELDELELRGSIDGKFEGLDTIFVRGAQKTRVDYATVSIEVIPSSSSSSTEGRGRGRIALSSSSAKLTAASLLSPEGSIAGASSLLLQLERATLKDLNTIFNSLRYLPSHGERNSEQIEIKVQFGEEKVEGKFEIRF